MKTYYLDDNTKILLKKAIVFSKQIGKEMSSHIANRLEKELNIQISEEEIGTKIEEELINKIALEISKQKINELKIEATGTIGYDIRVEVGKVLFELQVAKDLENYMSKQEIKELLDDKIIEE